jgi:hypothetical protein
MKQIIKKASEFGECAAFDQWENRKNGTPLYAAYIYFNGSFDDSEELASWFFEAGAATVLVESTLYCSENGDRNGHTPEGSRAWTVTFTMKQG